MSEDLLGEVCGGPLSPLPTEGVIAGMHTTGPARRYDGACKPHKKMENEDQWDQRKGEVGTWENVSPTIGENSDVERQNWKAAEYGRENSDWANRSINRRR